MKAPRPEFTTSRLNVGGYRVAVWGFNKGLIGCDSDLVHLIRAGVFAGTHFIREGKVSPEGVLKVDPEEWPARHYRRAVMGGAGVYRLGLWAFLAARRRGLQFTVPEPGASVEPHTVRVRGFADIPTCVIEGGWGDGPARRVRKLMKFCTLDEGAVSADGALSIEAGPWFERQLRQARMKAAGVYLAGLWALFASGHTREHLQGARDYANTSRNLDAWAERGHAPPPPPSEVLVSMSYRQIKRAYGVAMSDVAAGIAHLVASQFVEQTPTRPGHEANLRYDLPEDEDIRRAVHAHLTERLKAFSQPNTDVVEAAEAFEQASKAAVKRFLPTGRKGRAARRAFHAVAREVLRFLRRTVPRRAAHRPAVRAPRPLYAQATPPSAPLAPPAL